MGWSFSCDVNYTIADQLADFRTPGKHYSPQFVILRSVRVGNHHWALLEDTRNGHHLIALDLMKGPNRRFGEGSGYKGMSECEGPYHYDCPLSILDNAKAPENEHAYEWRRKVRAHHAARLTRKATLAKGTVVEYGGQRYRLDRPAGPRKGWNVDLLRDGYPAGEYRMKAHQIAAAKIIEGGSHGQPAVA